MDAEQRHRLRRLVGALRDVLDELSGDSAYLWANRLLALRCLEARELCDEVIVRRHAYGARSLQHHRFAQRHPERCTGEDDGLFEVLEQAFAAEASRLPLLFAPGDPAAALRPSVAALGRCIALLGGQEPGRALGGEPELFRDPTTLGWAYQYWHVDHKRAVFERLRAGRGIKLAGADLAAATQLYTPAHLVKFLVHNTLGARWGGAHSSSGVLARCDYLLDGALPVHSAPKKVRELSLLDPACGSGHFLLEAFELFYLLYQDEGELRRPEEICRAIVEHNLYGIDVDERAVQLCEAALWMKAAEHGVDLRPLRANVVVAHVELGSEDEALRSLLGARPDWAPLEPRLRSLLRCLGRAPELGALLDLPAALAPVGGARAHGPGPESSSGVAFVEGGSAERTEPWVELACDVLTTLGAAARSSSTPEAAPQRSFERALALVRLLGRRYDVVVTNPPYAGFRTLAPHIKEAIVAGDPDAALDLYVAFLSRFFDRLEPGGLLGAVTPASWIASASTVALRRRMLRHGAPVVVAALGQRVFEAAPLLFVALSVVARGTRLSDAQFVTLRPTPASGSAGLLQAVAGGGQRWACALLDELESAPLLPQAPRELLAAARGAPTVGTECRFNDGLWAGSGERDVREGWEIAPPAEGWLPAAGGQGYGRWYAPIRRRVRAGAVGALRLARGASATAATTQEQRVVVPSGVASAEPLAALEYSRVAGGRLSARLAVATVAIAGVVRIVPKPSAAPGRLEEVAAVFNSRIGLAWLRTLSSGLNFNPGYAARIPLSPAAPSPTLSAAVRRAVELKRELARHDPTGDDFAPERLRPSVELAPRPLQRFVERLARERLERTAELLELEQQIEEQLSQRFALGPAAHAGSGRRGAGDPDRSVELPAESALEAEARALGIGPRTLLELCGSAGEARPTGASADARVAAAAQTLWDQEKARALGDYLDVLVLRALGHRWPAPRGTTPALSGSAPVQSGPGLADDGLVPLSDGTGRPTALELVRARLGGDFPATEPSALERELVAITGTSLASWLTTHAFERHLKRFSRRPVLWQLQSGRGRRGRAPAFACWIHAYRLDGDTLPKLASQIVQPLRQGVQRDLAQRLAETVSAPARTRSAAERHRARAAIELRARIAELERFEERLRAVIATGFHHPGLAALLGAEPIDRFCAPAEQANVPADHAAWLERESRYQPLSDDGIRVNLAPLERAGLLALGVLGPKQLELRIADRAQWRAQARAACRSGVLTKPPWWPRPQGAARLDAALEPGGEP